MMHAYGTCPRCKGEGALWKVGEQAAKAFWFFGKVTMHPVYRCDECSATEPRHDEQN